MKIRCREFIGRLIDLTANVEKAYSFGNQLVLERIVSYDVEIASLTQEDSRIVLRNVVPEEIKFIVRVNGKL